MFFFIFLLLFSSCSKEEAPEIELDLVYLESQHKISLLPPLQLQAKPIYPWNRQGGSQFPIISKEFFRCKGSSMNVEKQKDDGTVLQDCNGKHSLPIVEGKEFVYPILIDLLNYIQKITQKRVIVTSGHRCPKHNTYADPSAYNRTAKHMIAAEVDFYVQGLELEPKAIVKIIEQYFQENPSYEGQSKYQKFSPYLGPTNVSSVPIRNEEVFVKIYGKDEGRDFDNRHPYPYINVQVRFDRELGKKVFYSWNRAYNQYFRY